MKFSRQTITERQLRRERKSQQKSWRKWHRLIGLTTAGFILLLTLTGVLINHAHHLQLDTRGVTSSALLDYYGIAAPADIKTFEVDGETLFIAGTQLWQQQQLVFDAEQPLIAATRFQSMLVAISEQQLYLFSPEGHLAETQSLATGLPPALQGIAATAEQVYLNTAQGTYISDADLLEWSEIQPLVAPDWVMPVQQQPDPETVLAIRASHLDWQQLLLDLHSGRIFGMSAVWLWDLFALALVLLSASGIYLSTKKSRK